MNPAADGTGPRPWPRVPTLAAIGLLALAVRVPGIFWGDNFPGGFAGHHIDEWKNVSNAEMLIDPKSPPRRRGLDACAKGMAVHVAAPVIAANALKGRDFGAADASAWMPSVRTLVLSGRAVSAVYGTLTVLLLYFFARRLTGSEWIALLSAAFLALGGLHVSQSHFYLSDVPALFWMLAGMHLLMVDFDSGGSRPLVLPGAALATGIAAGLKVFVLGVPSLALAALAFAPRFARLVNAAAFFLAGAILVNLASLTAVDLERIREFGLSLQIDWPFADVLRLYAVELLASLGAPVVALAAAGAGLAVRGLVRKSWPRPRVAAVLIAVVLPLVLQTLVIFTSVVFVRLDPYARHLLPLFPSLCLLAAVAAWHLAARLAARGIRPVWLVAPLLAWQALLVFDGEKGFVREPRNEVLPWLQAHVAPGARVSWPTNNPALVWAGFEPREHFDDASTEYLVVPLSRVNLFLSGSGLRECHPNDYRQVSPLITQERLEKWQRIFRGEGGYVEAARFREGYFMPELVFSDAVLGNHERNFLSEIVIFRRKDS